MALLSTAEVQIGRTFMQDMKTSRDVWCLENAKKHRGRKWLENLPASVGPSWLASDPVQKSIESFPTGRFPCTLNDKLCPPASCGPSGMNFMQIFINMQGPHIGVSDAQKTELLTLDSIKNDTVQ